MSMPYGNAYHQVESRTFTEISPRVSSRITSNADEFTRFRGGHATKQGRVERCNVSFRLVCVDYRGALSDCESRQRVSVVPGHPARRVGGQFRGVPLQFHEIFE